MSDPSPPERVVAEVCIPDGDGGEICASAVESFHGNGRTWVDCRVRARELAEAARAGEEGVVICDRCETTVVVQHGGETLLCTGCRIALDPGTQVTLHTGEGTDTGRDLYWDAGAPIWNNSGDTVIVTNDEDDRVIEKRY